MTTTYYRVRRCRGCDFECLTDDQFKSHLVARHGGLLPFGADAPRDFEPAQEVALESVPRATRRSDPGGRVG
jgi:hypothetical protein